MLVLFITILVTLNQQNGWFYLYTLEDTVLPVESPDISISDEGIDLRGSKSISVSTGSDGGLQVNQSIRLSVEGRTGKWGRIQGVINDNSEVPSGIISRNLSGYSEIFLRYLYRGFVWSFGKMNFKTEYFSSPMIGGVMEFGPHFKLARGVVPGALKIKTFSGIKNPAIPIKITEENEKIVEGTLRAFLNEKPLRENRDFSVDYVSGTFHFLPGIEVNPEDRLRLEYISGESFGRKNLTALEFSTKSEWYSFKIDFDQVSDDKDYWIKHLGKEAIDSIRKATGKIRVPSWKFAGRGKGDYDLVDSIFVFRGEGKGSYLVSFNYVGEGEGDYRFNDAGGFFYFAGRGMGDYTPYIFLTPPERRRRIFLNSQLKYGDFSFNSGAYLTFVDENILSGKSSYTGTNGYLGMDYTGRYTSGKLWLFQSDSGGQFLSDDLSGISGRGFLFSISAKRFADFNPGLLISSTGKRHFVKAWLKGRFYSTFYEESDSQKRYGMKFFLFTGNVRAYLGLRRFFSKYYSYSQISGGVDYEPYLRIKTSRRLFDDGRLENSLDLTFQTDRLGIGYRLVSISPGDSIFQTVSGEFSGFLKNIGYSARLRFMEDIESEFSYRYVFVGAGNGSFCYDSTSGKFYRDPLGCYERQVIFTGKSRGIKNLSGDVSFNFKGLSFKYSGNLKFLNEVLSHQRSFYATYTGVNIVGSYTNISGHQMEEKNLFEEGVLEVRSKRITPGVRFSRIEGSGIQSDRYYQVYSKFHVIGSVIKMGVFKRPSYPVGFIGEINYIAGIFHGTLNADCRVTYIDRAPSGVYPSKGFSLMYSLRYSHEFLSHTQGEVELKGRKEGGRHIYTVRASVSIQF